MAGPRWRRSWGGDGARPQPTCPAARGAPGWGGRGGGGRGSARGRQLRKDGIEIVTLESTSDYWRIWFSALEACGLAV